MTLFCRYFVRPPRVRISVVFRVKVGFNVSFMVRKRLGIVFSSEKGVAFVIS